MCYFFKRMCYFFKQGSILSPMNSPLNFQGRTILITRPQPEAETTAQQVRACHGQPLVLPSLTILPPRDLAPLHAALRQHNRYHGVILTSANGARALVSAMPAHQTPPPLFVVGKKTAKIVQGRGWPVHLPALSAGGEALAQAIMAWKKRGSRFLFLRAAQGREELITLLQQGGYHVDKVEAYRAEPIQVIPEETKTALAAGKIDATLFFSGRTAEAFVHALPEEGSSNGRGGGGGGRGGGRGGDGRGGGRGRWLQRTVIAVISPVTAQTVQQLGLSVAVISQAPSSEKLLEALHQYWVGCAALYQGSALDPPGG